ncbi:MAG: DUF748 domain-containing protein [bacterium]|nr:DUF748 domain-containing protein [bacterium]
MDTDSTRPRRRRLIKWVAVPVAVSALAAWIAPKLAAPWVRRRAVQEIEKSLAVDAEIAELSFDLAGGVHVGGMVWNDALGRELVAVERVDVEAAVLRAIGGTYDADVTVDGFVVHVRQNDDGTWNLAELPRVDEDEDRDNEGSSKEKTDEEESAPPAVASRVRVQRGRIVVHGADARTELTDFTFQLDLASLEAPAPYELSLAIRGPQGEGGTIRSQGEVTLSDTITATSALQLDGVLLAALEPALELVLPLAAIEGRLGGEASIALEADGALRADASFAVEDVAATGTREGASTTTVGRIALAVHVDADATRAGSQQLTFEVGEALKIGFEGTTTGSGEDGVHAIGDLTIDGDLKQLTQLVAGWVPMREGLDVEGRIVGSSHIDVDDSLGGLLPGRVDVDVRVRDVAARGESGELLDLGELSQARVVFAAQGDGDLLSIGGIDAAFGPVRLSGAVRAAGLAAGAQALDLTGTELELNADLESLGNNLAELVDLEGLDLGGTLLWSLEDQSASDPEATAVVVSRLVPDRLTALGYALSGEPLAARTRLFTAEDGAWRIDGHLDAALVTVTPAEGAPLSQRAARVTYTASSTGAEEAPLEVEASYTSETARLGLASQPESTAERAVYRITLDAGVEAILRDLGPFLELGGYSGSGAVDASSIVTLEGDDLAAKGKLMVRDFVWVVPEVEGRSAVGVEDPQVEVTFDVTKIAPPADATDLDVAIDSTFLAGTLAGRLIGLAAEDEKAPLVVEGLRGEFTYVPDRLGALLGPWLPGKLSGAERESLTMQLDGEVDVLDPASILNRARGDMSVGLGLFETTGLATQGRLDVQAGEGVATVKGDLRANGGTLGIEASLRPEPLGDEPAGGRIALELDAVSVNAGLSPLLALAHPAFGAVDGLKGGQLGGLISGALELEYNGPLSLEELKQGWDALPKDLLRGSGHLEIDEALLVGSPLVNKLFEAFDADSGRELSLDPVGFQIDSGRLKYDGDWTWTLGGTKTTFTGSVGLDQSLKLKWNVPVDDALIERYDFLSSLRGDTIQVPIRGTSSRPKLEWKGVIDGLAKKALTKRIQDELDIGDLLGGGDDEEDEAVDEAKAQRIFDRAGRLWDEGDQGAARKLYKKLRDSYDESAVYAENKKLIKTRAKKGG